MATTRRTSTTAPRKKTEIKKAEPVEIVKEKASIPSDWEKQAREIIKLAKSAGLQENFFYASICPKLTSFLSGDGQNSLLSEMLARVTLSQIQSYALLLG